MRLRDRDELDPRAERELDAVERALDGKDVEPDLAGWAELAEMLRDERPEPDPEWAAELDERASDRFPRSQGEGGGAALGGLAARLGELFPRRLTPVVAGLAVFAVVGVVAATTLRDDRPEQSFQSADSGTLESTAGSDIEQLPTTSDDAAAPSFEGDAGVAPSGGRELRLDGVGGQGPISPGTENRKQDRDVTLALSAPPEEVNDVSDEAIAITRDLDGIVSSSNVTTAGKSASANLQLVIPTRNLDTAIDRLTEIGDVKSLSESSVDITHPYVSAKDRLDDAEAERRELLEALGNASTDEEAEALRLQIADARKEIARAQAALDRLARRAQLSEVSLTIEGDRNASSAKDDDDRTLGDWLDDAAGVLRDVAGVLLISAAILLPLTILVAIAWLIGRTILRRRRESALND